MNLIVFEDLHVARLEPVTLSRPAYAITCGASRLIDLVGALGLVTRGVVRSHLEDVQRLDFPALGGELQPASPTLLLNARVVPDAGWLNPLREWVRRGDPGCVWHGQDVAAVLLPGVHAPPALTPVALSAQLAQPAVAQLPRLSLPLALFEYPHDIIRHHCRVIKANLRQRVEGGQYRQMAEGVFVAEGARLHPSSVCDPAEGPIVLETGSSVGAFTLLQGPIHLGPGARINEHAAIKRGVSLGHATKVGGEIQASIVEPYSNKQHHGYLGHAYLGSWVNLGAGTCNSDLKNTYGLIRVDYRQERVDTGMQFLGCVIGDYTKTAINTSIFTGKTIGVCSTVYGLVAANVPSFANYARELGQVTELPPEVVITMQKRVFDRRGLTQRPCDVQLVHDMYRLVRDQRRLSNGPLQL